MALADFQTLVDGMVRDDETRITTDDRDAAIALAVSRYSGDRPRRLVVDLVADGGHMLDLPAEWQEGFSEIASLEYPIGRRPPAELSPAVWRLYEDPDGLSIMLADSLAAGAEVRCTLTVAHQLDALTDTIPALHREPVAAYAASVLLDQLASATANNTDSTISADSVDRRSQSQEYAARAKAHRQRYLDALGVPAKKNTAHGVVVDLDLYDSRGQDRLTHPARFR